jgi:hypothetical protein
MLEKIAEGEKEMDRSIIVDGNGRGRHHDRALQ